MDQEPQKDYAECSNCKFWIRYSDTKDLGCCRRFPPKPLVCVQTVFNLLSTIIESTVIHRSPDTKPDDWCGEWEDEDDTE